MTILPRSSLFAITLLIIGCDDVERNHCEYNSYIDSPVSPVNYNLHIQYNSLNRANVVYSILAKNGKAIRKFSYNYVEMTEDVCASFDSMLKVAPMEQGINYIEFDPSIVSISAKYRGNIVKYATFQKNYDKIDFELNDKILSFNHRIASNIAPKEYIPGDEHWKKLPKNIMIELKLR